MPDVFENEWAWSLASVLDDAGDEVVYRVDREPHPATRRLMAALGVRVEVKPVNARTSSETVTYCSHPGCSWSFVGTRTRAAGFLETHTRIMHGGKTANGSEALADARAALDRMDAGLSHPREDILADINEAELAANGSTMPLREDTRMDTNRPLTREACIAEIQRLAVADDGRAPAALKVDKKLKNRVTYLFGTWNNGIAAAGLEINMQGKRRKALVRTVAPVEAREPGPPDLPAESVVAPARSDAGRDPMRFADYPYDADVLAEEASFLQRRASALLDLATAIQQFRGAS